MIPALPGVDSAIGFARDGYLFGSRRFERLDTEAFRTRVLGIPVVVLRGGDACRFFYEGGRFDRTAALPPTVTRLLQDAGSVQTLEGDAHRHRKSVFIDALMSPTAGPQLSAAFADAWEAAVGRWNGMDHVVLRDEVPTVLARAVFEWAGISLSDEESGHRADELASMIDNAGRFGSSNWVALARRAGTERWVRTLIADAREHPVSEVPAVLETFARATDESGRLLPVSVAAVELINVLRPFVAISRFVLFAFLALRRRPDLAEQFRAGDDRMLEPFAQEVRRFYPFFPVIAGRATRELEHDGHTFARGSLAMLDLFGTDRDPAIWGDPDRFRPERFAEHGVDPNHLIAQGGGTYLDDHRCPGEPLTVAITMEAVRLFTRSMTYDVPQQDLRVNLRKFPAAPESGIVLTNVAAVR